MSDKICPEGWWQDLHANVDFERAFEGLAACDHCQTDALRGIIRVYQHLPDDAIKWFDKAMSALPLPSARSGEDVRAILRLHGGRLEARFQQELLDPSSDAESNTDAELRRIESFETPYESANRIRLKAIAAHSVLRGNYTEALETYERLLGESENEPEHANVSYTGAANAAFELGLHKKSRRHYENAELCMAFSKSRLFLALYAARLAALCKHWGWEGESTRWRKTIDVLPCPEATRSCLHRRADVLYDASVKAKAFALA